MFGVDALDDPFTVDAGITLRAELSVASLGDDVVDALGWDADGDVVLEGTIGLDFEQLLAGDPPPAPSAITSLSLSATIPNGDAPSWVPADMTWPTGGDWSFAVSYDTTTSTFALSAGLDGAELTLPGDDSPLTVSLGAAFTKSPDGLQIDISASVGDWETPFGVEWLTIDDAALAVSITKPPAPDPLEVTAGFEGSMQIDGKEVELSVELATGGDGVEATVRFALNDPVSLAEVAEALGQDIGAEGAALESLTIGPAELVLTVGGGGWNFESSVALSWDPYGEDDPIAANVLLNVTKPAVDAGEPAKPTRLVLGVQPQEDVSLDSFLPDSLSVGIDFPLYIPDDPETTDVDETSTIGFVYSSHAFKPLVDLPDDSITRGWFEPLFAGVDPENANVVAGLSVYGALPVPDAIQPLLEPLGLTDQSHLTGKLPIGTGASMNTFSLSMALEFDPARLPASLHAAGLSLQISVKPSTSEVSISLKGSITFAIEQGLRGPAATALAAVGVDPLEAVEEDATCPHGGVVKAVGSEFFCNDLLTLSLLGEISVSATESGFTVIGDVSSGGDGWRPFGIDWFVLRQLTATFGVAVDPGGTTIDFGLAGNVDIAGKNIAAAVQIGLRPIVSFPWLTVDFDGFRAAAPNGLSFGDIVTFANSVTGSNLSLATAGIPDIGLRNLSFSLSPKPAGVPELCIANGLRVQADLYIDPPVAAASSPVPICDPTAGVPVKPGPSASCAARRSEGCFAGILLDISNGGIIGQGSVAPFSIGPLVWSGGEIDLAMTPSDQHLKVAGAGSITVGTTSLIGGQIKLAFSKTQLQYYGAVQLLNGALNVLVDGQAGIGVFNGEATGLKLHVLVATSSANIGNPSLGGALVTGLTSGLQELNKLVDSLDTLLTSWEAAGGGATQLLTELPAILSGVGITVPAWVKDIVDAIKYIDVVDILGVVNNIVDAAINGVSIPLGSICFGLLGCIHLGTIDIPGLCTTVFPSAAVNGKCTLPGIARTYITPLFRTVINAAVDGLNAINGPALDTALKVLFDGVGKVIRLDCAEFFTDLGPGATNRFALKIRGAVFGEPIGLSIDIQPSDFTNLGSRVDEVLLNLISNVSSGAALPSCAGYNADLFGVGVADPEAPVLPTVTVVGAESVEEAGSATVKVQMTGVTAARPLTLAWGDGTSQTVTVGTTPQQFSHTYADDDPTNTTADSKTITVTDSSTTKSASDTMAVTNVRPTVSAAFASADVNEGSEVAVDVSVTDPGNDSHTVLVTWGDGSTSTHTMAKGVKAASKITVRHTFPDDDPTKASTDAMVAQVSVLDDDLGTASASATLNVDNVDPVVEAGSVSAIDEGGTATVNASFTDVGLSDTHAYIVNWGDGTSSPLTEVSTTAGAGSVVASHQYGDDGLYTITLSVGDDDTGQGSDTTTVAVGNIDPTAAIDEPIDGTTWILADGIDNNAALDVPTMLATAGVPSTMTARSTDPGSDDLTVAWTWGDGRSTTNTNLVNGPATDPLLSASVQPRSIADSPSTTWTKPCLVQVTTTVTDDDGGSSADSTWVVVTGTPSTAAGHGSWKSTVNGKTKLALTPDEITCYLRAVDHLSPVFGSTPDAIPLSTAADALAVLDMAKGGDRDLSQFDAALLTGWMELIHGGVGWNERVDTNGDNKITAVDMTFGQLLRDSEALRATPGVTARQLKDRRQLIRHGL